MGVVMKIALVLVAIGALCSGCRPSMCGWDEALTRSNAYTVTLDAPYPSASMTASYSVDDDLTRIPIPSCGASFDEVAVAASFDIAFAGPAGASTTCGVRTISITRPSITSTGNYQFVLNDHRNLLRVGLARVISGACRGGWEFTVHAPGNDPFASQVPGEPPVVLAYRVFSATPGAEAAACAALLGLPAPGPTEGVECGDAFVATMTPM